MTRLFEFSDSGLASEEYIDLILISIEKGNQAITDALFEKIEIRTLNFDKFKLLCSVFDLKNILPPAEFLNNFIKFFVEQEKNLPPHSLFEKYKELILFFNNSIDDANRLLIQKKLLELINDGKNNAPEVIGCYLASGGLLENLFNFLGNSLNQHVIAKGILYALSYPSTKFNTSQLEENIALDSKLAKELKQIEDQEKSDSDKNITQKNAVSLIQNYFRLYHRVSTLYPRMFFDHAAQKESYLGDKENNYSYFLKYKTIKNTYGLKEFGELRLSYLKHANVLKDDGWKIIPVKTTKVYLPSFADLQLLLNTGTLMSKKNREMESINVTKTLITDEDSIVWDDHIISTAPFEGSTDFIKRHNCIEIDLKHLPQPYLNNMLIKLADFYVRDWSAKYPIKANLTEDISISNSSFYSDSEHGSRIRHSDYSVCYKGNNETFSIDSTRLELFHGEKALEDSVLFLFDLVKRIPNSEIQANILKDWSETYKASPEKFFKKMDNIYNALYKYMEIAFLGTLKLSFDYVSAIYYKKDNASGCKIDINVLKVALKKGNEHNLRRLIAQHQVIFNNPFFIRETLRVSPLFLKEKVKTILMELCPEAYFTVTRNLTYLNTLTPNNTRQLIHSKKLFFDKFCCNLKELFSMYETNFSLSTDEKNELKNETKFYLDRIKEHAIKIFENSKFSGIESCLKKFLLNPIIIHDLLAKDGKVLLAIIAAGDEWEIKSHKSQRDHSNIKITLASILKNLIQMDPWILMSIPMTLTPEEESENDFYSLIIRQKKIVRIFLNEVANVLENALNKLNIPVSIDLGVTYAHDFPNKNPDLYQEMLNKNSVTAICTNKDVEYESMEALKNLNLLLKESLKVNKTNHTMALWKLKEVSIGQVADFLLANKEDIFFGYFSHYLFDTAHFSTALKIPKDKFGFVFKGGDGTSISYSFSELMHVIWEKISNNGIAKKYPIFSEQFCARVVNLNQQLDDKKLECVIDSDSTLAI